MNHFIAATKDGKFAVRMEQEEITHILTECNLAAGRETGGILIGYYTSEHDTAVIVEATNATSDSQSGTNWFFRGIKDLQSKLHLLWVFSKRQYYLGEWHYHPGGDPSPSGTDVNQMMKIAASNKYRCPEPVLLLVGGVFGAFQLKAYVFIVNKPPLELISDIPQSPSK